MWNIGNIFSIVAVKTSDLVMPEFIYCYNYYNLAFITIFTRVITTLQEWIPSNMILKSSRSEYTRKN